MVKNSTILILILELIFFVSCGQNSNLNVAQKFLAFLNNYQTDSLHNLVADNYQLKRTYTTYTNDKLSFIEEYIPTVENYKGKYRILKTTANGPITDFLVEDQSDYLKYLIIQYPKWKIQITANGKEKIESMIIDTTDNYQDYLIQAKEKGHQFDRWMKEKYPDETNDILFKTKGLLIQRLKEYSNK